MIRAVARKELATLWTSPLPYIAGALFHALFGVLVINQLDVRDQAVLQPAVPIAGFLLVFAVPLVTMRTVAEETRTGTLEVLLAARLAPGPIVAGKWIATWVTTMAVLAPLGVVVALVSLWGEPDFGPVITGAIGLVLLSAALSGVGVLTSSLTASQPTTAIAATFTTMVLWFAHSGSGALRAGDALSAVSFSERLQAFADGAITTGDAAFFVCVTVVCLAAAAAAIDGRRLR